MRSRKQPFIRLNIQKQNKIAHIDVDRVDLGRLGGDERVGVRVEDGGESVNYKAGVVGRDLEDLGDGKQVDPASRRLSGSLDELVLERA